MTPGVAETPLFAPAPGAAPLRADGRRAGHARDQDAAAQRRAAAAHADHPAAAAGRVRPRAAGELRRGHEPDRLPDPGDHRAGRDVHRVHQPGHRHRLRAAVRRAQAARRHSPVPRRADRGQDRHRDRGGTAAGRADPARRAGHRLAAGRQPGRDRGGAAAHPARHRGVQRPGPADGGHAARRGHAGRRPTWSTSCCSASAA